MFQNDLTSVSEQGGNTVKGQSFLLIEPLDFRDRTLFLKLQDNLFIKLKMNVHKMLNNMVDI